MESMIGIEIANDQQPEPAPEEGPADDERTALIADELREAIRRKVEQLPG